MWIVARADFSNAMVGDESQDLQRGFDTEAEAIAFAETLDYDCWIYSDEDFWGPEDF